MAISKVNIALDAYMVCLYHSLTTECEEIMGLLIGYFPNIPVSRLFSVEIADLFDFNF